VGEPRKAGTAERHEASSARGPIRSAVYGTVIAMSVLAYLGDHDTGPGTAVVTVVGTGVVIFFAEAYAGLMAVALAEGRRVAPEVRHEVGVSAYAAVPGVMAGLVLLVTALFGLDVATRIDVTLWVGVAALTVLGAVGGRSQGRTTMRVLWTLASLLVGVLIVVLKAALH
jgi:hypothetical protein